MKLYQFAIILYPDPEEGGFTVTVPALPGCVTEGDTWDEAIAMAKDAIGLYLADLIANGESVPEETDPPRLVQVTVDV